MVDDLLADGRTWDDPSQLSDPQHQHIAELLSLMNQYPEEQAVATDLISETMARISAMTVAENNPESICPAGLRFHTSETNEITSVARSFGSIQWREIASIAAVVLLLISITVPMLQNARAQAVRQKCCAHMMGAAIGFSQYGNDHQGNLPAITDPQTNDNWLQSRANSANLFALAKSGFVTLETLSCPGNKNAEVNTKFLAGTNWPDRSGAGYAYQNQLGPIRTKWQQTGQSIPVLSDCNPIADSSAKHLDNPNFMGMPANMISPSHGGKLQNVLLTDGSVIQLTQPIYNGDNIWLPRNINPEPESAKVRLTGREFPVSESDSMLIP